MTLNGPLFDKIEVGQLYKALDTRTRLGFRSPWWRQGDVVLIVTIKYDDMMTWAQGQGNVSFLMPNGTLSGSISFNEEDFFLHFKRAS